MRPSRAASRSSPTNYNLPGIARPFRYRRRRGGFRKNLVLRAHVGQERSIDPVWPNNSSVWSCCLGHVVFEDVAHGLIGELVTEIDHGSDNSVISPSRILLRHPHDQLLDFIIPWRTSQGLAELRSVELAGNQLPIPRQQRVWSGQQLAALLRGSGESALSSNTCPDEKSFLGYVGRLEAEGLSSHKSSCGFRRCASPSEC